MILFIAIVSIILGIFLLMTKIRIDLYREVPKSLGVLVLVFGIVLAAFPASG